MDGYEFWGVKIGDLGGMGERGSAFLKLPDKVYFLKYAPIFEQFNY
jgi:hypothetical protein